MSSYNTIRSLQTALTAGETTVSAIVDQYIKTIDAKKQLNAFLEVFTEEAQQRALQLDEKRKSGPAIGKLHGVVVAIKDVLCYKDHVVTAASKILEGFESLYSSTVVERLLAEDAIIIGRLNCDEFAMGSSNENSAFGKVLNPLNEKTVPGGSSGGSAAAVAANLCHVTLGSDTGGSIRQPASFTGTVGLKPTYGRISRWGLIAYASSFDQIGIFGKNVEDVAIVLEVIAGADDFDSTVSQTGTETYSAIAGENKKYKLAYFEEAIQHPSLDKEIALAIKNSIQQLKEDGHTVEAVKFDLLDYIVPAYYVLTTAEASSNLARFSGIHYGYRSNDGKDLESTYKKTRSQGFGKEVKRRIMLGTFVLSAGYYDAYYNKGQKVRRIIQNKTFELLKTYDALITPSTPGTAFEFGKNSADPIKMYLEDIFTVQANIAGVPAISIPSGIHSNGLPMGIQLMCNYFEEDKLFEIASLIE